MFQLFDISLLTIIINALKIYIQVLMFHLSLYISFTTCSVSGLDLCNCLQ